MGATTETPRKRGGPRSFSDWTSTAPYKRITVTKTTPTVGAAVDGVDLSQLDDETFF